MSDFPDYEAAALMILQCCNLGVPPKQLPDIEAAKLIVDVALGDESLYREATSIEDKMWRESGGHSIDVKRRQVVRIWSKEKNKSGYGVSKCEHCGLFYSAGTASRHNICQSIADKEASGIQ